MSHNAALTSHHNMAEMPRESASLSLVSTQIRNNKIKGIYRYVLLYITEQSNAFSTCLAMAVSDFLLR